MRGKIYLLYALLLFLSLVFVRNVWSQTPPPTSYPLMNPDNETLNRWINDYWAAPEAIIDASINSMLFNQSGTSGTSINLIDYVPYVPDERTQGGCGNCWVWAGTGVMEISHTAKNNIKDRLSIEFFDSCVDNGAACGGGWLSDFATSYGGKGFTIPWSNTNASYQDGGGYVSVSCSNISLSPRYTINSITQGRISTYGVGQATAIVNIKNILNQHKAIWYAYFPPEWNSFFNFWNCTNGETESSLWQADNSGGYCGWLWPTSGHAMVIVGYDDSDPDPAKHYWLVLNSWGTAGGNRPNGLYRMAQQMNYDCHYCCDSYCSSYCTGIPVNQFLTLDTCYSDPGADPDSINYPSSNYTGSFTVSWSPVIEATSYTLQRATNSSFTDAATIYNGGNTSYNQTCLSNGTYYYRVRATNSCGNISGWRSGSSILAYSTPDVPASISYPSVNCTGSFTVNWSSAARATSYTLQRATNSSFTDAITVYTGSNTSYNQSGLSNGTYYYRVKATNSCGDSGWENGTSVTVGPPATPASISYPSLICNGASFSIGWSSVVGATSYTLQRATNSSFTDAITVYTGSNTSYNQSGLSNGTYYYRVKATNSCGDSGWENGPAIIANSTPDVPPSISYPSVNCTGNFIVSWSSVARATSYTLQRATNSSFTDAATVYNGSNISYQETNLTTNTYYYQVKTTNACGTSGWKRGLAMVVGSPSPASINYPLINCTGSFIVSWPPVVETTGYALQRATNPSFTDATLIYSGNNTLYSQSSLSLGTYYYRIKATNICGDSAWKNGPSITVGPPATPASISYPSNVWPCTLNPSPIPFTVNWSGVIGANGGYTLQRATNSDFSDASLIYSGNNTSYTESSFGLSGTYYYRVKARNVCGDSGWENGHYIVIGYPSLDISYPVVNCNGSFTVSWSSVLVYSSYNYTLQRTTDSSFSRPDSIITVYNGSDTSYTESGLSNGTYYYRVGFSSFCGGSSSENGHAITIGPPVTPANISLFTVNCTGGFCTNTPINSSCTGNFTVSWASVTGATAYVLQRDTISSFTNAITVYNGGNNSYIESNLSNNNTYYYRVKATNVCGDSGWENGASVTVGPPVPPANIGYSSVVQGGPGAGSFTVSWSSVIKASSYTLQRATNSLFTSATTVYNGSNTSYNQPGLGNGTYYYRVKARNTCGYGDWKNGSAITINIH